MRPRNFPGRTALRRYRALQRLRDGDASGTPQDAGTRRRTLLDRVGSFKPEKYVRDIRLRIGAEKRAGA